MIEITQSNNENAGDFTLSYDGENAGTMQYKWKDSNTFNIVHTEVDQKFEGKGLGKKLVNAAVDFARKENKKIVASCSYAHSVLKKDDSLKDIFVNNQV